MKQEVYSKGKEMHTEMKQCVIFKEEDEDGQETVTEDEGRVNRYQISEIVRLSSSKNFILRERILILDTLIDFEPM